MGGEMVLFLARCELGLGIPTAAQCGEDVEWLLFLAVESMDVLNMVVKDGIYLYMWGIDNDISTTNTAHDAVVGIQSSCYHFCAILLVIVLLK